MANIALAANSTACVVESIQQHTAQCAEDIAPRSPVRFDPATGKFTLANATTAAEAGLYGISTNVVNVKAGGTITAIKRGLMDGFAFTQSYGAAVFLSDTDGRLGDAAGTVPVKIGTIVSAWAQPIGAAADKLLSIEL